MRLEFKFINTEAIRTILPKHKDTIYPNQQILITDERQTFKFTAVLCVVCPSGAAVFSCQRWQSAPSVDTKGSFQGNKNTSVTIQFNVPPKNQNLKVDVEQTRTFECCWIHIRWAYTQFSVMTSVQEAALILSMIFFHACINMRWSFTRWQTTPGNCWGRHKMVAPGMSKVLSVESPFLPGMCVAAVLGRSQTHEKPETWLHLHSPVERCHNSVTAHRNKIRS